LDSTNTAKTAFLVSAQAVLHVGIAGSYLSHNPASMHISSVAGLYSAGMTCPHATKTLLVLPPLSSCLIKLTLDITHSMVRDNVWFRIYIHYVFYFCVVVLVLIILYVNCCIPLHCYSVLSTVFYSYQLAF